MSKKKKQFVVAATPNQETWCEQDADYYGDYLEGETPSYCVYYFAYTSEEALDRFHREWPIKCLDDWEIDAFEMNPEVKK